MLEDSYDYGAAYNQIEMLNGDVCMIWDLMVKALPFAVQDASFKC
ncbi:MAG: hypothetical protein R2764_24100 [Bacteroidales bacterium]